MKFNNYKYVRPDLDELKQKLTEQVAKLTDDHTLRNNTKLT